MKKRIADVFRFGIEVPYVGAAIAVAITVICGFFGNPDWIGELD